MVTLITRWQETQERQHENVIAIEHIRTLSITYTTYMYLFTII